MAPCSNFTENSGPANRVLEPRAPGLSTQHTGLSAKPTPTCGVFPPRPPPSLRPANRLNVRACSPSPSRFASNHADPTKNRPGHQLARPAPPGTPRGCRLLLRSYLQNLDPVL